MKLGEILAKDAIIADLASTDRDDVLREMIQKLVDSGNLDQSLQQAVTDSVIKRENDGSTGFGKGVAVPHARMEELPSMMATIGISQKGVDFNALDKQPVYSIVMLLSPTDKNDEHLLAMERIFVNLKEPTFRSFLRQADTVDQVLELIEEKDSNKI